MHGKIGDIVFRRMPGGGMSLIMRVDISNTTWSEAHKDQRKRFKATNAYAKAVMLDEAAPALPSCTLPAEYCPEKQTRKLFKWKVHPERLELPTACSEDKCSIQLSYGCQPAVIIAEKKCFSDRKSEQGMSKSCIR